ncbi:MAG: sulfatase-like hydrolase/transferase [Bacteroidota bacterium]
MSLSKRKTPFLGLLLSLLAYPAFADSLGRPPNIVLLLADDVALMDFGVYGGEAQTPNIDRLAKNGTIFTNYHASPMCAPSRAMLLTGYDSHLTGVPNLPLFLPPEYTEKPTYKGTLNNTVKTVATYLKEIGYETYMTGKWHLGHDSTNLPSKRGFDRTFILDASGADNYEHKAYLPTQGKPPWFEDGRPVDLPKDFYSSKNLVDKMIEFMDADHQANRPFFSFISFQAIHIPVQVPRKFTEKYIETYRDGWEKIREKRIKNAKNLGLFPHQAPVGAMLPVLPKWEDLSEEAQKLSAKSMAVNAGMLEAMDFHLGRYIDYLKKEDLFDNTIFIITSDNGPEGSQPSQVPSMEIWMQWAGYHRDYDRLGEKGSFTSIGPQFASAASGPNAYFKFYAGEGGLRVPLIMAGPTIPPGVKKAFSFVTDITPTLLDLSQVGSSTISSNQFSGKSLLPVINGTKTDIYTPDEPVGMEAAKQAALFKGDYKLAYVGKPYGDGVWRLYNLTIDPGETKDLAESKPKLFQEMMADYEAYKAEVGVLEMPEDYETLKEVTAKLRRKISIVAIPLIVGLLLALIGWWISRNMRKPQLN